MIAAAVFGIIVSRHSHVTKPLRVGIDLADFVIDLWIQLLEVLVILTTLHF